MDTAFGSADVGRFAGNRRRVDTTALRRRLNWRHHPVDVRATALSGADCGARTSRKPGIATVFRTPVWRKATGRVLRHSERFRL